MKFKPDPTGPWLNVTLGEDPRLLGSNPPKKPPPFIMDRANEFREIEYRAKHGLSAAPAQAKALGAYLASYRERFATKRKPGSLRELDRHIARFAAFCAARNVNTVQGVTRAVCRDYLESRAGCVAATTLTVERGFLAPIWTRAEEDGLIVANPWKGAKVAGKRTPAAPTFWTSEEIAKIAAACLRPWQKDLVLVLANTGLRISAGLALRWSWIDWGKGTIRVPVASDKGGYGYVIAMTRGARNVLEPKHYRSKSDLVFPHPATGKAYAYDTAGRAIARAIRQAKVPPGSGHDLRHSFARSLERAGVPMSVIQGALGHRSPTMTTRYTSATEGEAAKYVADVEIGGPAKPTP